MPLRAQFFSRTSNHHVISLVNHDWLTLFAQRCNLSRHLVNPVVLDTVV